MAYSYNHDCPFEAYITNLGKYNEGELVGEWVKFPTTHEEMQEVFKRIGIDGVRYEEWFITDYDCYVDGIYDVLGEYESLDELNYLANSIEEMDRSDFERFEAAVGVSDYSNSVKDLINLTDNLDKYDIYPDVHDHDDLGRMYIDEYGSLEVPEHLKNYIDYEAYGRNIAMDEIGHFTDQGYIRDTGDSFMENYDGDRENIPWEYRVTATPEEQEFLDEQAAELSEDEKLEMSQELAFDLDEFFRQKDPQYAAAHPDAHAGKELIADLLLEGKTAVIKDRLAEMAQTPEDELVSRIGGYEQATGYEAYLDTDIPAVREKLEQAQEHEGAPIAPDDFLTGEKIKTPRGSFSLADMTREQMEAAGYGYHHGSDDGRYHIMGNGTRAFAIINENARTYDIYQLKDFTARRDYAFEPLDRLREQGRSVDMQNYDKVYSSAMRPGENLESIYTRFNMGHPEDFTGHSLSVSDVVVIHQNGQDAAHYCDSFGFVEVPEFLEPVQQPEAKLTFYAAECMEFTSMGEYRENLTLQEAADLYRAIPAERMNGIKGIGFTLEDSSIYNGMSFPLVQGSTLDLDTLGGIAYYKENPLVREAVQGIIRELPDVQVLDKGNYLQSAEMSLEDDYGMIDGIVNNGKKEVTPPGPDEKTSIRDRLAEAKRECAERKPPEVKKPEKNGPEHDL